MKKTLFFLLIAIKMFAINCGDFTGEFKTFNGHYYAITGNKMSFESARKFAQANNGYLAIPNNEEENSFIKSIIGTNNEAWIGIYDPNYTQSLCFTNNCYSTSRSRFKTVQGSSLSYENWDNQDIENQFMENDDTVDLMNKPIISLLGEHWVLVSGNSGKWRDWGTHFITGENPSISKALIEFESEPICYESPSNITDNISGRVCNSQIWDNILGVSNGTTAECQEDINKIEYCPQSLAECGEQWDYDNGYSVAGIGEVTDYTNKVQSSTTKTVPRISLSKKLYEYYWNFEGAMGQVNLVNNTTLNSANKLCCIKTTRGNELISTLNVSGSTLVTSFSKTVKNGLVTYNIELYIKNEQVILEVTRIVRNQANEIYTTSADIGGGLWYAFITSASGGDWDTFPLVGEYFSIVGVEESTTITICPIGYTETTGAETLKGECKSNQNYTYYNYICNTGYNPIDSGGNIPKTDPNYTSINDLTNDLNSETSPLNNCKKKRFTCLSNPERGCALVDSKMQCSPFPCIGNSDIQNLGTVEGENDKNNDGWANDGSCKGQLYIFNGEDKRCRASDKLFGLTGGGCCDKDKVFMGLVACKDNEKILAKKRQNNNCHYVGKYCSKKLKFLGCIQTSESYCCFNSKLGRIIQEQGRPQLNKSWGEADNPDCKGFTPDEFQKLDFSKLDFTEFAKDIQTKTTNFNNIGGFVQNKVQNFFQQ